MTNIAKKQTFRGKKLDKWPKKEKLKKQSEKWQKNRIKNDQNCQNLIFYGSTSIFRTFKKENKSISIKAIIL